MGVRQGVCSCLSVMGCVNTKLAPETPPSGTTDTLVSTLYPAGHTPSFKNKVNGISDQTSIRTPHIEDTSYVRKPPRKVAKYRAKFDPRVTAKYEIKALIGRGSFSRVVRVEHKINKQPYAIKMIDRVQGKDVFESELAVLRRVRHDYIIRLIEVFETREKVYMVMDLATGGELFDRIIAKGMFTERDATLVLLMVLSGLKYLHALGITHRDLKPENLLYYHPGHDSKILITDFGLSASRKSGEEAYMQTTCGTPEYIAPEILARKPYTCGVDLWSVGVITYILLSGTMPFDDDNRTRLYRLILKAKYSYSGEHWKDVSPPAKDFIDRLLVLDPTERLQAAVAVKHPWLTTAAATSSNKNLHRTISKNLLERQSTRNSVKSAKSSRSTKSSKSLRSEHRRVMPEEIDALHKDPEVQAELSSLPDSSPH